MSKGLPLFVVGNLTADPELRTIASGASVVNFTIARSDRRFDRDRNEWVDGDTMFLRCSAWRRLATNIAASLTKGMRVVVAGGLVQRSYTTQSGEERTSMELQVDSIGPDLSAATARVTRTSHGEPPAYSQPEPAAPLSGYAPDPVSANQDTGFSGFAA